MNNARNVEEIEFKLEFELESFVRHYVKRNVPVVIRNIASGWLATKLWNPKYLSTAIGDLEVDFRASTSFNHPELKIQSEGYFRKIRLREFETHLSEVPNGWSWFVGGDVCTKPFSPRDINSLERILVDIVLPDFIALSRIEVVGLWISARGVASWLHYDQNGAHNFNVQIRGQKQLILVAPVQAAACDFPPLSTKKFLNFSRVDAGEWSREGSEREHQNLHFQMTVINEGDAVYIPPFWLHRFEHLGAENINVNFWWKDENILPSAIMLRQALLNVGPETLTHVAASSGRTRDEVESIHSLLLDSLEQALLCTKFPELLDP